MKKYKIKLNGKEYEVEVEEMDASAPSVDSTPAAEAAPAAAPAASGEAEEILAPLPGNVLNINVTEGSSVKKGDTILILEAMKLENEVVAPRDGVVTSIKASKGAAVVTGECLVVLN